MPEQTSSCLHPKPIPKGDRITYNPNSTRPDDDEKIENVCRRLYAPKVLFILCQYNLLSLIFIIIFDIIIIVIILSVQQNHSTDYQS